jgi:hypothetical protein
MPLNTLNCNKPFSYKMKGSRKMSNKPKLRRFSSKQWTTTNNTKGLKSFDELPLATAAAAPKTMELRRRKRR